MKRFIDGIEVELKDGMFHVKHTVNTPSWIAMDRALRANPDLAGNERFWDAYKKRTDKEIELAVREYGRALGD